MLFLFVRRGAAVCEWLVRILLFIYMVVMVIVVVVVVMAVLVVIVVVCCLLFQILFWACHREGLWHF